MDLIVLFLDHCLSSYANPGSLIIVHVSKTDCHTKTDKYTVNFASSRISCKH